MNEPGAVPPRVSLRWSPDAGRAASTAASAAAAARKAARPRVPPGPRWLPVAALMAGVVGAVSLPGAPPGLGVAVSTVAVAAALVPSLRGRLSLWTVGAGTSVIVLACMSVVRDADWLVALDLFAAFAVGSTVLAGGVNFRELLRGTASVLLAAPMAPAYVGKPLMRSASAVPVRRWGRAARAVAVTALLLLVFGALFASADAAFGSLAEQLIPNVPLAQLPNEIFVFLLVAGMVGAGAAVAAGVAPVGLSRGLHGLTDLLLAPLDPARLRARPSRVEWMLPLAALNLLFAAFVAVQFATFFGGRRHLLATPGLTAAEYARSGFFQLLAVCLLTLVVIAAAVRWVDRGERQRLRLLLGSLCVLTGVVLLSAARRLRHYEDAFGYTRLRLFVFAVMAIIAVVLVLLLAAGVRWDAGWLPRAVLATAIVVLLGLNVMNADGFIAGRNIDRTAQGVPLDTYYLSGLSADALPQLLRLPPADRACLLQPMRERLDRLDEGGWRGANVARARARSLIGNDAADCRG